MRNSDDYVAVLIAAGPGLVPAAAWWAYEAAFGPKGEPGTWLFAYPVFLIAALPGLPVLGSLLAKGIALDEAALRVRPAALLASGVLPLWHVLQLDLRLRIFGDPHTVSWPLVARYAAMIWITTAACWILYRRQQVRRLSSPAESAE